MKTHLHSLLCRLNWWCEPTRYFTKSLFGRRFSVRFWWLSLKAHEEYSPFRLKDLVTHSIFHPAFTIDAQSNQPRSVFNKVENDLRLCLALALEINSTSSNSFSWFDRKLPEKHLQHSQRTLRNQTSCPFPLNPRQHYVQI